MKIKIAKPRYKYTLMGILSLLMSLLLYLLLRINDLLGSVYESILIHHSFFGEYTDPNLIIAQPLNTWSNLFLSGAGIFILWRVDRDNIIRQRTEESMVAVPSKHEVMCGFLCVFLGVGSFFMHAGCRGYTGLVDTFSMNMYIIFIFVLSYSVLFDLKDKNFYIIYTVTALISCLYTYFYAGGKSCFTLMVPVLLVSEILMLTGVQSRLFARFGARNISRDWRLFFLSSVFFLGGYIVWQFGHLDSPGYNPYSLLQPHAFWHFFCAAATVSIFFYARSAKKEKARRESEVTPV